MRNKKLIWIFVFILILSISYASASNLDNSTYLKIYYTMNETSGNINDISGNSNTGTQSGTVPNQTGLFAGARGGYSTANYFTPTNLPINANTSFAIRAIVKVTANNTGVQTIFNGDSGNAAQDYYPILYWQAEATKFDCGIDRIGVDNTHALYNVTQIRNDVFYNVLCVYDNSTARMDIYVNGVNGTRYSGPVSRAGHTTTAMAFGKKPVESGGSPATYLHIDEVAMYYNYVPTTDEITQLGGSTNSSIYPFILIVQQPTNNVSFVSQNPADITAITLFSVPTVNITYNYRNDSLSAVNYSINYTLTGNLSCIQNLNGTCTRTSGVYTTKSFAAATSYIQNYTNVTYTLMENDIYPSINLLNQSLFNQLHTKIDLVSQDILLTEVYGINASENNYYYLEQMVNVTTGGLARIYLCNSTYTSGSVATDPNCQEIGQLNSTGFNHTHNANSSHSLLPFNIINGKIDGGIGATSTLRVAVRRVAGTVSVWYVPNQTRSTTTAFSNNGGATWSPQTYTEDLHLHVYPSTNDLNITYRGQAYYNGTLTNSSATTELIDLIVLSPTAPIITNPLSTVQNSRYLNITWLNATGSAPGVNITAYNLTLRNADLSLNRTIANIGVPNNSYYYDVYAENLSLGIYYVQVCARDSNTAIACDQEYFNLTRNGLLNFTATYNSSTVSNFTIYELVSGLNYTTTTGNITLDIIRNQTYRLVFDNPLYAYGYVNITPNSSYAAYQFIAQLTNSVNITIYDLLIGNIITQNVSLQIQSNTVPARQYNYVITTGNLIASGLTADSYTFTFTSTYPTSYTPLYIQVNVTDRTAQTLNAYMSTSTAILFNFKDAGANSLPGVFCTSSTVINGTLTILESNTAATGSLQFYMIPTRAYLINCSLSGYEPYSVLLNPVTFTSYTVVLKKINQGFYVPTAIAKYTPSNFYNGQNSTFSINFYSPFANFVNYSYTFTSPNGTESGYGTYTTGQNFNSSFFIPKGSTSYPITLNYTWYLDDNTTYTSGFIVYTAAPYTNKTLVEMGNVRYGMFVGDRIIWLIIGLIFIMGLAWFGAGLYGAFFAGMAMIFIFIENGFLGTAAAAFFYIPVMVMVGYMILKAWYTR